MIWRGTLAALGLLGAVALGGELSGWWDLTLSLSPDPVGFTFDSIAYFEFADGFSASVKAKLADAELDRISLQGSWYERPLRLKGSCEFKAGAFYRAAAEFRYWQDPWLVKLWGELPEGKSVEFSLSGNYDDDVLEVDFELRWEGAGLSRGDAYVELPSFADWRARFSLAWEAEQTPSLGCRAYGPTPWGKATLEWTDFTLARLRFQRESEGGGWRQELDLDWELDSEPELDIDSTHYVSEEAGYGLDVKVVGLSQLTFKKLSPFLFGPGWKLTLAPVDQEISLRVRREFDRAELGCDLAWGQDGLEGELWLDFYLGEVELIPGFSCEEGFLEEFFLEIYLEF